MTTDLNVLWQHLGMRNKIEHWGWPAKIQSLWTIPKLSFRPKLWRLCNLRAMWQEDGWRVHKLKSARELNENVVSSKLLYALVNHATNHLYTLLTFHRSVWRVVIPIIILQDLMELWNSAISECCDLFMRKHGKQEKSRNKEGRHFSLSLGLCLVSTASLVGADKSYNLIQPYPKSSFWCDRIAFTYLCLICHDWDVFLQFSTYRTYPWWILDKFGAMWEHVGTGGSVVTAFSRLQICHRRPNRSDGWGDDNAVNAGLTSHPTSTRLVQNVTFTFLPNVSKRTNSALLAARITASKKMNHMFSYKII